MSTLNSDRISGMWRVAFAKPQMQWEAVGVLTQARQAYARPALDTLADTIAAVAIRRSADGTRTGDPQAFSQAGSLVDLLRRAGTGLDGVPYAGAAERLFRIASSDQWVSPQAALALTTLPNRPAALQYLRQLALSDANVAPTAVYLLASDSDTGPAGLAILRQLFNQQLVVHPIAREHLQQLARLHGWT
jgi:hypothetical protein